MSKRVASKQAIIAREKSLVNIIGARVALAMHVLAKCKYGNYGTSDIETN